MSSPKLSVAASGLSGDDLEEWRPVLGWEGAYEVSSLGRVRSLISDCVMKPWINLGGYDQVGLSGRGSKRQKLVHRLVCEAFYGSPPAGNPLALHGPRGKRDNSISNLRWGSNSDNMRDRVDHGTDVQRNKTACTNGHTYDETNTVWITQLTGRLSRRCRKCTIQRQRRDRDKGIDSSDKRHGTVSGYSRFGCRCDPCRLAYSEYGKRWRSGKS